MNRTNSPLFHDYQAFLHQELPLLIRHEVEQFIDDASESNDVIQHMRNQLPTAFLNVQARLLRIFNHRNRSFNCLASELTDPEHNICPTTESSGASTSTSLVGLLPITDGTNQLVQFSGVNHQPQDAANSTRWTLEDWEDVDWENIRFDFDATVNNLFPITI